MPSKTQTTATHIAETMGNDGRSYFGISGHRLTDLCESAGGDEDLTFGDDDQSCWRFVDGSTIIDLGACWMTGEQYREEQGA